jgi:ATP-dependent helicase/nuclease subunit B
MSGLRHLTEALQGTCEGEEMAPEWTETLSWYKENQPERLTSIRTGMAFTNKQEDLGRQAADALFKRDPEQALSLSPSRLERFSRCPFSHFILYGLKPEERRIFEIAPREIGDIYHECLMQLTRQLTVPGTEVTAPESPWMTITEEECREFAAGVVGRQTESYREGLFHLGNEENYRTQRIVDICQKVCWVVIEQVRAGQIKDCRFEVGFGRGREIAPVEVKLDGQTAYIEGKIDRVDYLAGDRVKIIDYKTGNEKFDISEAEAGYRLQLMLYLEASLEKTRKPAGVFYFNISEPLIDSSAKAAAADEIADQVKKTFKLNGVIVDDPAVIHSVAGDFSGYSDILPLRANKEGEITPTGKGSLLTEAEFAELQETVGAKVTEICQNLANGDISIHPMKTRERSACTYCQYKGICRFDTIFEGCSYNII